MKIKTTFLCFEKLNIQRPKGLTVMTTEEALEAANKVGELLKNQPMP